MIHKRENSESRAELVRAMPSRKRGRALLKDSIETAYSFLHQKRRSTSGRLLPTGRKNVYIHSTLDWQKDDIELAIGSYVDDMSQVIGLPLRSSKNSMKPYPTAGLIS